MPRVLFGVTVPVTAVAFLRDQLLDLADQGWDVHLACSPDPGFEELNALTGVTVHALPMHRNPSPVADARGLAAWRRLLREVRPDVVVASTPKAGLLGMLAARQQRVPVRLYHVRGLRAEGLSGPMRAVSLASERAAVACATDVLCDSPSLLASMREHGILGPQVGLVLGAGSCCGVDTARFRPPTPDERAHARDEWAISPDDVVIGFVGRLAVDKGVPELLAAVRAARDVDPRLRLLLIGPMEDGAALDHLVEAGVAEGWVTAPGPLADPARAYWAFDVFCLPSHREGFPISPLEAQASGVPVVTTTATGCIDAVAEGVTGLTVPPGDAGALTAALSLLSRDDAMREGMGRSAADWARNAFDQAAVRARFIDYLTGLAQRRDPGGATR